MSVAPIPDDVEPPLDVLALATMLAKNGRQPPEISDRTGLSVERVRGMMPELTYRAPSASGRRPRRRA